MTGSEAINVLVLVVRVVRLRPLGAARL